jgi:hypothetical protein
MRLTIMKKGIMIVNNRFGIMKPKFPSLDFDKEVRELKRKIFLLLR